MTIVYLCPGCGTTVTKRGRCPACNRARGTTTQRGYGTAHQQQRARLLRTAIGTRCPICTQPMLAGQPLDLDHSTNDKALLGDRIVHAGCNRGRRFFQRTPPDPPPTPRETHSEGQNAAAE